MVPFFPAGGGVVEQAVVRWDGALVRCAGGGVVGRAVVRWDWLCCGGRAEVWWDGRIPGGFTMGDGWFHDTVVWGALKLGSSAAAQQYFPPLLS